MAKKWIITEENDFIMGNVGYHFQLAKKGLVTIGGGWWEKNDENKTLCLYNKSTDFGRCTEEEVRNAIENSLLSPFLDGYRIIFSKEDDLEEAMKNYSVIKEKGDIL